MRLDAVHIVMVEPQLAGNVGAAARAMKTMGLAHLHLVRPRQFPHADALARAAGADDLLERARVHDSLEQALAGMGFVAGLSARSRHLSCPAEYPRPAMETIAAESARHPVALLFGRERTGLTNEELDCCHRLIHIPADPDYASLNVAAAIQVVCYELRWQLVQGETPPQPSETWPLATADQMEQFYVHLEKVLGRIDFLRQDNPRALMRRLRVLYNRARPDHNEMQILRGILAHVEKGLDGRLAPSLPPGSEKV
ncbi:RNA methyltransferase [Methylonatrum kenyense]|uniref:RNA methyltransferase n=1 Tax=Methylonatrum kenyense TaxID=455253 RepID=UPI0020BF2E1E|nr:RNA methyltransferase [Methylonatrum kenyense]MCK8515543.1 RNA methyltransferase [Methylonatrum kenyense]